ncbi:uncharacterized protein VNE69_01296 [Vairimorpha necatrix]|uniref:Uncharacterized protein n=1 Tax=Vairimorpha necatrix TaxID=6039 RepID=A0AAX4J8T1_9MICR
MDFPSDTKKHKKVLDKIEKTKISSIYRDFISENPDLLSLNDSSQEEVSYYSFVLAKPYQKLLTFTVNGNISFYDLILILHPEKLDIHFFNIKNFIICDISNEKIRNYVLKMFTIRNLVFVDHTQTLKSLIKDEKIDVLYFKNNEFYKMKVKNIANIYKNIEKYFRFTDIEIRDVKCHLCKKDRWEVEMKNEFIFTERFNKFCKKCHMMINKVPRV